MLEIILLLKLCFIANKKIINLNTKFLSLTSLLLLFPIFVLAQTGTLRGVILDETNTPVSNVNIKAGDRGTITNINGFYGTLIHIGYPRLTIH